MTRPPTRSPHSVYTRCPSRSRPAWRREARRRAGTRGPRRRPRSYPNISHRPAPVHRGTWRTPSADASYPSAAA